MKGSSLREYHLSCVNFINAGFQLNVRHQRPKLFLLQILMLSANC